MTNKEFLRKLVDRIYDDTVLLEFHDGGWYPSLGGVDTEDKLEAMLKQYLAGEKVTYQH